MDVKKIICSVESAIMLKKHGVKQDSIFYYVNGWKDPRGLLISDGEHVILSEQMHITKLEAKKRGADIEFVSAFTVGELGIMLPLYTHSYRLEDNIWLADFVNGSKPNFDKEEANARSKFLINLIEIKVLLIDKINLRIAPEYFVSSDNF